METQCSLIDESNTFRTIRTISSALSLPSAASTALFKTWTCWPPSRTPFDSDVLSTRNSWQPFSMGKLWRARCAPPWPALNGTWISRALEEDFNYPQTYRHNLRPEYSWWERCRGFHMAHHWDSAAIQHLHNIKPKLIKECDENQWQNPF